MTNSRVCTAASAAAVVPFHCVICFDEFQQTVKFPVVLPCGHTYVCNVCARRIKKCMECRQPLFWTPPSPAYTPAPPPTQQYYHGRGHYQRASYSSQGRYHHPPPPSPPTYQHRSMDSGGSGAASPVPSSEPVRYPLPKNLVLLAMMQAAEHHAMEEEKETNSSVAKKIRPGAGEEEAKEDHASDEDDNDEDEDDDDDEFDLNHVISGMVTFSGPCGTYAVREPEGLAVLPTHPRKQQREDELKEKRKKDLPEVEDRCDDERENQWEPFTLVAGQTVQVVNFENGVAKLAHGSGYIVASSSQLVKVGGPLARSCRLEGMADTLSLRGKDLKSALDEHKDMEARVRRRVELEWKDEPNYPIIADPLVLEDVEVDDLPRSPTPEDEASITTDSPHTPLNVNHNNKEFASPQKEYRTTTTTTTTDAVASCGRENPTTTGVNVVTENRLTVYNNGGTTSSSTTDTTYTPRSPNSIDNADLSDRGVIATTTPAQPPTTEISTGLPRYRRNSEDDLSAYTYGCDFALISQGFLNFENESQFVGRRTLDAPAAPDSSPTTTTTTTNDAVPEFPVTPPGNTHRRPVARPAVGTPETPVSSFMSAASPILSSSFDAAVDFRTGLSGHRGLSKTSTRLSNVSRTGNIRMMSEHRGILTGYSHSNK